jgi:hypothetical protein
MKMKKKTARTCAGKNGDNTHPHIEIDAGYTFPEQCINELLKIVDDKSPQSRRDLVNALQLARSSYDDEPERGFRQRPSSKRIDQLERTIKKTRALLLDIRKYAECHNIGFAMLDRGVVAAATQVLPQIPGVSDQELGFPPVVINIEPLLRTTLLQARRRRRSPGGPENLSKEAVVFYAERYFRQHSARKPSTDPKNPFHEFKERFYETVTKIKPDSLDRQTRKVLAVRHSGH